MGELRSICIAVMASGLACGLAGCQGLSSGPKASVYQAEAFEQSETFSRLFDTEPAKTCDAARRALLSQGYLLRDGLRSDNLIGFKNFQPKPDTHMQIEMHVTCSPDGADGQLTTLFVSALQDRYALKKSANAASLGVNAFGSLSIPLGSSDDSLVKVGSETIPAGNFYDRFFVLVDRLVREQAQTRQ